MTSITGSHLLNANTMNTGHCKPHESQINSWRFRKQSNHHLIQGSLICRFGFVLLLLLVCNKTTVRVTSDFIGVETALSNSQSGRHEVVNKRVRWGLFSAVITVINLKQSQTTLHDLCTQPQVEAENDQV